MAEQTGSKWYKSTIAQGIGALLLLAASGGGGAFFGKTTGGLVGSSQLYIEQHKKEVQEKEGKYTVLLNCYNMQIENLREDLEDAKATLKGVNEYILRKQGDNLLGGSRIAHKWKDEPHGTIIYKRNTENGKLYYLASNGERFLAKEIRGSIQFAYGKKNGIVKHWQCEYDNTHPGVIFYNVDKGKFKWE